VNARNDTTDIEDDGFTTIEFRDDAYWRQQEIYGYERMVSRLHEAIAKGDYDTVDEIVKAAHLKLHGPAD
jgi:hypothetical protein